MFTKIFKSSDVQKAGQYCQPLVTLTLCIINTRQDACPLKARNKHRQQHVHTQHNATNKYQISSANEVTAIKEEEKENQSTKVLPFLLKPNSLIWGKTRLYR